MNARLTSSILCLLAAGFAVPPQALADDTTPKTEPRRSAGTVRWTKTPGAVRTELRKEATEAASAAGQPGSPNPTGMRRVGRGLVSAGKMVADPTFVGAIALADLAEAGWKGDPDKVGDLGHSLTTPEFYAGIGLFNATHAGAEAALDRTGAALARTRIGSAIAAESLPPAVAAGGKLLKSNLVLAAALTLPRIVEFDFGGFTAADAAHADFSKLKNAHVGINPKVDGQDLAITLGSFAVAQPVWAGVKRVAAFAGKRLLKRFAATAAVQAAALAVPVGGEVFDVAVNVGLVLWTAVDLAGLLITAHAIEEPVKAWNDRRRFENESNDAIKKFLEVCKKNNGSPDEKEFNESLANVALAFRNLRDLHYLPAAYEDATFVMRLERWGVQKAKLGELATKVTDEFGLDLAALGQTAMLRREYGPIAARRENSLPGRSHDEFESSFKNYREHVKKEVKDIYAAKRLPDESLDPASKSFALSVNRAQLYDQEQAVYARAREILKNEELRNRMADEIGVVGAIAQVDAELVKEILSDDLFNAPEGKAPATPAPTAGTNGWGTDEDAMDPADAFDAPQGKNGAGPSPKSEGMTKAVEKSTKSDK